ncbi:MAG: c-type cytochrome [Candidatus Sericytochromatia bacterium]|uniref:C-type cytochrome n=1 Tax=Candidatus Tanganyikabacteria bacterium TaxID=2961651 RepID=A0A937X959_9BACT|nr:c-type cytochrome [Candidatus Tanganyikabacteria bacterium]
MAKKWLFQLLRFFPGHLEAVGVIGVPLLIGGALLLVPLLDRGPRRHLTRRPVTVGVWTLAGVAILWLTFAGATQQPVTGAPGSAKPPVDEALSPKGLEGWSAYQAYGCASCHRVGPVGNDVGPDLTHIGSRRPADWLRKRVRDPQAIKPGVAMPPFPQIPDADYDALIQFLSELK